LEEKEAMESVIKYRWGILKLPLFEKNGSDTKITAENGNVR